MMVIRFLYVVYCTIIILGMLFQTEAITRTRTSIVFETPVGIYPLRDHEELNAALISAVERMYSVFSTESHSYEEGREDSSSRASEVNEEITYANNDFFQWQRTGHPSHRPEYAAFLESPELQELNSKAAWVMEQYFRSIALKNGKPLTNSTLTAIHELITRGFAAPPFVWASYHGRESFHHVHTHAACALSFVYYVKVPLKSGALAFQDPRGLRAPFDEILRHHPTAGEFVVFPSSLPHNVEPSFFASESDSRISLAWNMPGTWTQLETFIRSFDDLVL